MYMRPFGKLGFDVSAFGFGAMRLRQLPDNGGIDYEQSTRMIRAAIDGGVNYFDTAYVYHGGFSEVAVGKGLAGGYRDKVKVATKLAAWQAKTADNFEAQLDESLSRLQTDHVDFYLFHAVDSDRWTQFGEDVMTFMDKMVQKGKVLYPSFSFHDDPGMFKTIIDAYDWKMAQVQINLLDENAKNQASLEGVRYAGKKGVPIVVMEPLRGGALAATPPSDVQALYDAFPVKRSHIDWAFRYTYDIPEVATILSGISEMDVLEEDLRIFENAAPNCMDDAERALIAKVRDTYLSRTKVGCTGCEYCLPCPQGIPIPRIFRAYDKGNVFGNMEGFKKEFKNITEKDAGQDACIECGACEAQCPQQIAIIEKLKEAAAAAV